MRWLNSNNAQIERALLPGADCGCPNTGKPVEDTAQTLTPIQAFKKASSDRWNIGRRKTSTSDAAAAPAVKLTPIQAFAAASKRLHK
jgi:hypothetical protein